MWCLAMKTNQALLLPSGSLLKGQQQMEPVLQHAIDQPRLKTVKQQLFAPYDIKHVSSGRSYQCDTSGLCCSNQHYYLKRFETVILLDKTHNCGYFLFMVCLSTTSAAQAIWRRMIGLVNVRVQCTFYLLKFPCITSL